MGFFFFVSQVSGQTLVLEYEPSVPLLHTCKDYAIEPGACVTVYNISCLVTLYNIYNVRCVCTHL